jgi:predicted metal-binding membrane protein
MTTSQAGRQPPYGLSTWVVMMAAMMLPAVTPMVLAYREIQNERRGHGANTNAGDAALLLAGYLAIWAAAGLLGYALLKAGRSLDGGLFAWDRAGRFTAAGVLVAAALYQLTPSKNACLSRCRSRRAFLLKGWRDGRDGALRIGMQHGAWCLGCCWALMAALFALGAMSVGWMALISVLIAAERLLPWRALATAGVASLLVVVAVGVATAPPECPCSRFRTAGRRCKRWAPRPPVTPSKQACKPTSPRLALRSGAGARQQSRPVPADVDRTVPHRGGASR